mgnify:CR=1 FL=1
MRGLATLVAMVLAVGTGYMVVRKQVDSMPAGTKPMEQIDTVAIQQTLLTIGTTERQYLGAHGSYGTLEQLAAEDLLPGGTSAHGYALTSAVAGGQHFTVTASPSDPNKAEWPTLEITESMQVTRR